MSEVKKRSLWRKVLKIVLWSLAGVVATTILFVVGLTLYLTPENLTRIANKEASKYLEADVRLSNLRFTIWSSYPHLCLEADSLYVRSRTLDSVPAAVRSELPQNADFLVSTGHLRCGINIVKALAGRYEFSDVFVDGLRLNLVAVTDSLNNYKIVPGSGSSKIPYFRFNRVEIAKGSEITFNSIPSQALVRTVLGASGLNLTPERNDYTLLLRGKVSAISDHLRLLKDFPFELDGNVRLHFKPFGVSTSNYTVKLGEIKGNMALDLKVGDSMSINKLSYKLEDCTVSDLLAILPNGSFPVLNRIQTNMVVEATARLTSPYDVSSATLPSLEVDFRIPGGSIAYTANNTHHYTASTTGIECRFVYDGKNPSATYLDVPKFNLTGEGVAANLKGHVSNLTSTPAVEIEAEARGSLQRVEKLMAELQPFKLKGAVDTKAKAKFQIVGGALHGTELAVSVTAPELGFESEGYSLKLNNLKIHGKERYPGRLNISKLLSEIPFGMQAEVGSARFSDAVDTIQLHADGLRMKGEMGRLGAGKILESFKVAITGDGAKLFSNEATGEVGTYALELTAKRRKKKVLPKEYAAPDSWSVDARTLAYAPHTPELLNVTLPTSARDVMAAWDVRGTVKVKSGNLLTHQFPGRVYLRDIDVATTFDTLRVKNMTLRTEGTQISLSATAGNLHQFLCTNTPAPLPLNVDVKMDTVQVNRIARVYAKAHPHIHDRDGRMSPTGQSSFADTLAMLIPRNIDAWIQASAKETRYINLHLYNLFTKMHLHNGIADIDTLRIAADFGHAGAKVRYNTADMQHLGVDVDVDVEDVDVVGFFRNFKKLLLMMPEMKNLSGTLGAHCTGHIDVFPNMYLNVPSADASLHVTGDGLKVKQNHFIRHITRMLLIRDSGVLQIADMSVRAAVHDNLLELFPFNFKVSDYELRMVGLNNFNGEMYYHIGVEKWPLKLPFGINIEGHYHHPKVHFGGKDWKNVKGTKITAGVMDYNRVNLVKEARRYGHEFVRAAAEYKGE